MVTSFLQDCVNFFCMYMPKILPLAFIWVNLFNFIDRIWRPSRRLTNSALRSSDRPTSGPTASVWPGHLTARHSSLDTRTISSESGRSPSRAAHNHESRPSFASFHFQSSSGTGARKHQSPTRCHFNYILTKFSVPCGHILARISQKMQMHYRTIYIGSSDDV